MPAYYCSLAAGRTPKYQSCGQSDHARVTTDEHVTLCFLFCCLVVGRCIASPALPLILEDSSRSLSLIPRGWGPLVGGQGVRLVFFARGVESGDIYYSWRHPARLHERWSVKIEKPLETKVIQVVHNLHCTSLLPTSYAQHSLLAEHRDRVQQLSH